MPGSAVARHRAWALRWATIATSRTRRSRRGSAVRIALAILGSMSAQGPLVAWVSTHRRHHQLSDREGDRAFTQLEWAGHSRPLEGNHARPFRLDDLARAAEPDALCPRHSSRPGFDVGRSHVLLAGSALGVLLPGIVLGLARATGRASHPDACGAVFCGSSSPRSLSGASIPSAIRSVRGPFARANIARTTPSWHCRRAARPGITIIMPSPNQRVSGIAGGNWTSGYICIGTLRLFGLAWKVWTPSEKQIAHAKLSAVPVTEIDPACPIIVTIQAVSPSVVQPDEPAPQTVITPAAPLLAVGL